MGANSVEVYDEGDNQAGSKPPGRKLSLPLIVAVAGIGLLVAGLALLAFNSSSAAVSAAPQVGRPLQNFTLTDLSGKQVHLADYAGRPILINAWATWCPPCRAEMPDLQQLYLRHQNDGFAILAINGGEDQATVQSFVQQNAFTFPILLDPQSSLLDGFGIRDYPTSILVGRDGKVKLVQVGLLTPDAIRTVVEPLISQ